MRRRHAERSWSWVVLSLAVAQTGCSWAFVERPPAHAATLPYFDCTTSHLAPNLDAVSAGVMGLATLGALTDSQSSADTTAAATMVVIGAGFLASAIHGWNTTGDCREAKLALQERVRWRPWRGPAADPWRGNGEDLLAPAAPAFRVGAPPVPPEDATAPAAPPGPSPVLRAPGPVPPPVANPARP